MSVEALLPMMEAVYNRRKTDWCKIEEREGRGKCVVAVNKIEGGAVLMVEKALHAQPTHNHPSLKSTPEYQSLVKVLDAGERNSEVSPFSGNYFQSEESKAALDRLAELNAAAYMAGSPNKDEIWTLEDSHRFAKVGDTVMVDGLYSEAGKKLNGKIGRVLKQDENDGSRLGVKLSVRGDKENATKSIKACNLKTLGGIMRTNAYHDGSKDTTNLFRTVCRINHACGESANSYRAIHHGKAFVVAKKDILPGEEILLDYLPSEEEDRLRLLQRMFNFRCRCHEHSQEK